MRSRFGQPHCLTERDLETLTHTYHVLVYTSPRRIRIEVVVIHHTLKYPVPIHNILGDKLSACIPNELLTHPRLPADFQDRGSEQERILE